MAQKNKHLVRADWKSVSMAVMLKALRAKFNQHAYLNKLLKDTGNKTLVEDARANDNFWGAGADGNGENHLGQLLMQVRTELP